MSVIEHAEQVLELLIINRLGFRPILFVAHSLGGLLVKNLLRASCDALNRNQKRIALSTRGVVFFATPNSGSRLATNLHALLRIAFPLGWVYRPSRLIAELRAHQPELLKLNQWYRDRVANPTGGLHIDTKVYYESYPAAFGLVQIVDAASADPGIPGVRPVPVAADHFDICKFPDRECATYNGTLQFLSECLTKQSGAPPAGQTRRYIELKFPGSVPNDLLVEIDPNPLGNENLTIRITGSRGGVHE
jgi:pimeloyl-ACP methyl ester carboxylesterase